MASEPPPTVTPTPTPAATLSPTFTPEQREDVRRAFKAEFDKPNTHEQHQVQWSGPEKEGLLWVVPQGSAQNYRTGQTCPPEYKNVPADLAICVQGRIENTTTHPMLGTLAVCDYNTGNQIGPMSVGDIPPGGTGTWSWPHVTGQYLCKVGWLID